MKVALIHRDTPRLGEGGRMVGWWSYPVKGLEWDHFPMGKRFRVRRSDYPEYDLIVYEDGKLWGEILRDEGPTVAYHVVDSTLSEGHYRHRLREARRNADLVLVDFDRLERFEGLGMPVYRFGYCVNERLFYPRGEKEFEVGSFQGRTAERGLLERYLTLFCERRGYRFAAGRRFGEDYARAMAACKIVVNLNRNRETRNHRLFDAMAGRSCVLTNYVPPVSGEERIAGVHYVEMVDWRVEVGGWIERLLGAGEWEKYAEAGYRLVRERHRWGVRAGELTVNSE
jgi:hypothetical protein